MTTAPGRSPAMANGALVEQIRQAIQDARSAGQPTPGRPTLVTLTGATDHAVRKALGQLAASAGEPSPVARQAPTGVVSLASPAKPARPRLASAGEPAATAPLPDPEPQGVTDSGRSAPVLSAGGRFTARAGFVFGSVTSVAANVLAARIPPVNAGQHWSPNVAAEIGAAVWPLILLLSVEILSRVRWPRMWQWGLAKFGGAGTVALGSAVISYGHIRTVLMSWDYNATGAGVGPLVVDGLMVISGFALLAMSHQPSASTGDQNGEAG